MIVEYRIVKRESFKVIVKAKQFRNEITADKENHEIPDFWGSGEEGVFCEIWIPIKK